jgi:hypothetical protein
MIFKDESVSDHHRGHGYTYVLHVHENVHVVMVPDFVGVLSVVV